MVVFACASHLSILLALYFATRFAGDEFERALVWSAGGFVFFNFCKHCNESDSETIRMVMENCMSKKLF